MRELPRPGDLVISKSTSESLTARYAAQSYIRRRWKPIPVGFRSKRPIQWHCQHRGTTAAMQYIIFPEGKLLNVGVIQGGTSGGLTDVDLDCSKAIALAKIVLLKTAAIGGGDLRDRGDGGGRGAGGRGAGHGDGVGRSGDADGGRRGGGVGGDLGGGGRDGVVGGGGGRGRDGSAGGGHHCRGGGRDGAGPGDDFDGGDSRRRDGGGGGLGRSSGDAVGRAGGGGGGGRGGHGGADVGAQTIFPGSVHESGEDIKWADEGDPALDAAVGVAHLQDQRRATLHAGLVSQVCNRRHEHAGALDPTAIAALERLPERLHVRHKASITTCPGMATPIVIG